ncbi:MAG: hypothetical protein H6741_14550 [Alphaproteobacteria bacterium]|nr:hypothetical protein [Alphaproteobacteria bacterium]
MPRMHLMEIEDQPWCPAALRDGGTAYLDFVVSASQHDKKVTEALRPWLRDTSPERVVVLGAGGGGSVGAFVEAARAEGLSPEVLLTDYYPSAEAFARVAEATGAKGHLEPVDARAVPESLTGARVLFNAFHHFRPEDARAILADAAKAREPIAIVEFVERSAPLVISMFFTPLVVALSAPFWKPFRLSHLLLTWLVPLIPMLVVWDGVVSCLRIYDPDELRALTEGLDEGYTWEVLRPPLGGPATATILLGRPS